jgi:hypothetical protein
MGVYGQICVMLNAEGQQHQIRHVRWADYTSCVTFHSITTAIKEKHQVTL